MSVLTSRTQELNNKTVNDWLTYLREVQLEALVRSSQSKIGGANCTLEVEESKLVLGRSSKHNRQSNILAAIDRNRNRDKSKAK